MGDNLNQVNVIDSLGSTLNRLNKAAAANKLVPSNDFKVSKHTTGQRLELSRRLKPVFDGLSYKGEYNTSASYNPDDVARVLPDKQYLLDSVVLPAFPGVWRCNVFIPDKKFSDDATQFGYNVQPESLRDSSVAYYPQWPEPTTDPTSTNKSGKYWELISMLPTTMSVCIDGQNHNFFCPVFPSGSQSL